MQDSDLIDLLKQHNQQGMDELLSHYVPFMRYIIAPILPDYHEREECLADMSMRVWEKIDLYDTERGNFKSWLSSLARNVALNHARKNRHLKEMHEMPPDLPSPDADPEEQIIRQERIKALGNALQSLSSSERALFYRKYYYIQSTAQIASELGMTERAVEGRLYRLKKQLRRKLGGEGIE
jgi:RNA polymerase sigma-70 factor (ECF subfamily)